MPKHKQLQQPIDIYVPEINMTDKFYAHVIYAQYLTCIYVGAIAMNVPHMNRKVENKTHVTLAAGK